VSLGRKERFRVPPWRASSPTTSETYYDTEEGCKLLCRMIIAAWRAAGHYNVTAEPVRTTRQGAENVTYVVKTNLVNGLPPKL
jgi:hypothetical protein